MAYESDRWGYMALIPTGLAAAAVLMHPGGYAIVAAVGTMISNPGDMAKAAGEWRDPKGAGGIDIDTLKQQLIDLREKARREGKWEGEAGDLFATTVDGFVAQLDNVKRFRQGTADTLDQTAALYHGTFQFAKLVIGAMTTAAAASLALWAFPPLRAGLMMQINTFLKGLDLVVKAVMRKKLTAIGAVTLILMLVDGLQQEQGRLFYGMQSMPEQETDFTQVSLQYDKTTGLTVKPETPSLQPPQPKGGIISKILGG
ncbi:WXG100 family type VII secretion target [Streptosporangium algeriense]|uniref:WXG100 family type VII secretion target n=1 Tax=Streptosporangium algeriense TaxID=1682748 RepID=A0ABW3DY15_9ACTN